MKIRSKYLIFTTVICLVMILTIAWTWYYLTAKQAVASSKAYTISILKNSNGTLIDDLKDTNLVVSLLAYDEYIHDAITVENFDSDADQLQYQRLIQDKISTISSFRSQIKGVTVGNYDDRFYSINASMLYEEILRQPWIELLKQPSQKSQIIFLEENGRRLVMGRGIFDESTGENIGFVVAELKENLLQDIFDINLVNSSDIFIIDNDSQEVIFSSIYNDVSYEDLDKQKFTIGDEHFFEVSYDLQYNNWTTVALISEKELLSDYNSVLSIVLIISLGFACLAIVVTVIGSNVLTRNIVLLTQSMKKIDKSNLAIDVVINEKDEVGELYQQFNKLILRIENQITEIKQKERDKRQAELDVLRHQINPHFMFNALNTIKFLGMIQNQQNIVDVSEALSRLMHINMQENDFITIEEEMNYIRNYVSIQKYRLEHDVSLFVDCDEGSKACLIPKLILQPFVENAFKHGFDDTEDGVLRITTQVKHDALHVIIKDNGVGFEHVDNGIGFKNTKARLELYFNDHYDLSIESQINEHTTIRLRMPIKKDVDAYE